MEKCKFGSCCHFLKCSKREQPCEEFKPCVTYMDKYDNDLELWAEMHGESEDE